MIGWLWERVRKAVETAVENAIWVALGVVVLLAWKSAKGHVTLPIWGLALAIGAPLVLAVAARRAGRQPPSQAAGYISELESQNALYGYYAKFLWDALGLLQQAMHGRIPGVTRDGLIEQGILEPAREFLRQAPGEDVRLSILVPDGTDFVMCWMAGHRFASKQNFRLAIVQSFSRYAYQTGEIQYSEDVDSDARFRPHPMAERPYRSLISAPLRSGDTIVGVLNVVSTLPFAFTLADFVFIVLLAALVDVAWAIEFDEGVAALAAAPEGE